MKINFLVKSYLVRWIFAIFVLFYVIFIGNFTWWYTYNDLEYAIWKSFSVGFPCALGAGITKPISKPSRYFQRFTECSNSLGYLRIYPPQIPTVMKLISFCFQYNPVSHTKSLGESQERNMVFQGHIWSRVKAFKKILDLLILPTEGIFCT